MSTPEIQLHTLYVLDADGRIVRAREPGPSRPPPALAMVRSTSGCAWAMRTDLPAALAREVAALAREEPPLRDLRDPPVHEARYIELLGGRVSAGPAFTFPEPLRAPAEVVRVQREAQLEHHFHGWEAGEIADGRGPVVAIFDEGHPVSICFCARRSDVAAEAGLETAEPFRRRGFGARVTLAWAAAIRASGLTPLYSTSWINAPSLAVARKLGLVAYASDWRIDGAR
jgi:GNAT acetyltransferase-like protein